MPETAEQPTLYGIVHTPAVSKRLTQDNAASAKLMQIIFEFQTNPRPDGHQAADEYGPGLSTVLVDSTVPPYEIIYRVDEAQKRVVVLAISDAQWR